MPLNHNLSIHVHTNTNTHTHKNTHSALLSAVFISHTVLPQRDLGHWITALSAHLVATVLCFATFSLSLYKPSGHFILTVQQRLSTSFTPRPGVKLCIKTTYTPLLPVCTVHSQNCLIYYPLSDLTSSFNHKQRPFNSFCGSDVITLSPLIGLMCSHKNLSALFLCLLIILFCPGLLHW